MTPRLLVVVFLTVALAITAYGDHRKPSVSVARTGAQGSVVGRIHACGGIGYAKLQCVRGTVVVLRGRDPLNAGEPRGRETVFPTRVVARQRVAISGHFHFTLPPGPYVIELPRYASGHARTWASTGCRFGGSRLAAANSEMALRKLAAVAQLGDGKAATLILLWRRLRFGGAAGLTALASATEVLTWTKPAGRGKRPRTSRGAPQVEPSRVRALWPCVSLSAATPRRTSNKWCSLSCTP